MDRVDDPRKVVYFVYFVKCLESSGPGLVLPR
jgi:hypothetical protein